MQVTYLLGAYLLITIICTAWDQNDARTLPKKLLEMSRDLEKSLAHDAYVSPASEAIQFVCTSSMVEKQL
jgi:hypothetical protein